MIIKKIVTYSLAATLALVTPMISWADTNSDITTTTMENCGAYLFEWRPVDCGNGHYFAILVGGFTINERDVILSRGYDFAYTFNPSVYPRTWGEVPTLVNVDGVWAIPENQNSLPEGIQPTLQIVLYTNNGKLPSKERYIDVVRLPSNVDTSTLPAEVRKYLINVDGSDAGAYDEGTDNVGWVVEADGRYRYRKPDKTFVSGGWLNVDDELYYMDENGYMLTDTLAPDGSYVNASGARQKYQPGWMQNERGWKYVLKNGYFAASTWVQDTDGKYYYFDMGGYMRTDYDTPDGTGVRDYIHVVDLAKGHVLAIEKYNKPGLHVCNLGTGQGYSVLELVHAFERVNGVKVKYEIKPRRAGDIATCYADPTRAKEELGWVATRGIDEMCRDTWNFAKTRMK